MRIGMLTGGGDCPGLNAVIRAVVRKGIGQYGHTIVGYRHGWRGPMQGESMDLSLGAVRGLLPRGGTILGTSRTNPYKVDDGPRRVLATLARDRVDALIAIGGEDTLGVALKLDGDGVKVVGVPKTIDNDLSGTDFTFGFHTAVQTATDAIETDEDPTAVSLRTRFATANARLKSWSSCPRTAPIARAVA